MKWWGLLSILFVSILASASPASVLASASRKADLIHAIDSIEDILHSKYALLEIKKRNRGWDPLPKLADLRQRVSSTPDSVLKSSEMRQELVRILRSAGDLHLRASVISSERATLPFQIRSTLDATGIKRFQIAGIDSSAGLDLKWGDEIVLFNGVSCAEWVEKHSLTAINPENTKRFQEMFLTERLGHRGDDVPRGDVVLKVRRNGREHEVRTQWNYKPDLIGFPGDRTPMTPVPLFDPPAGRGPNFWALGGRDTYVLAMGQEIATSRVDEFFKASIQKVGDKKIGYIRIPGFFPPNSELATSQFAQWIAAFESQTSALVIDLANNPGGGISFSFSLLTYLVNTSIDAIRAQKVIDFSDVTKANTLLLATEKVTDDRSAEAALRPLYGSSFTGLALDRNLVESQREEARGIMNAWERGSFVTDPIPIQGAKRIHPRSNSTPVGLPPVTYSKKIVVVVNGATLSAAESFAAILQDSGRAIIFGERTPGAGATQRDITFPNRIGIEKLSISDGIMIRPNGDHLEDQGVIPQHVQPLTPNDLMNGYADFRAELVRILTQ